MWWMARRPVGSYPAGPTNAAPLRAAAGEEGPYRMMKGLWSIEPVQLINNDVASASEWEVPCPQDW